MTASSIHSASMPAICMCSTQTAMVSAIFLATEANDFGGKYLGIWSCIPMFVTIGLEHSVANAFFLPLGMLYGADVTPMQIVTKNLLIVALGNFIGGGLLHAGGLSYQFGKLGEDD